MHYVVIGNGVAGINAANVIRERDEDADITIISYEHKNFFSRTALMYLFCGQLSERCIEPLERDHYDKMNFNRVHDKVVSVDPDNNTLKMENGAEISYDKLLIACGSVGNNAGWQGEDLQGVTHFVTWQDYKYLKEQANNAKSAIIVGGGLIGIEVAEVLSMKGIKVNFLIREDHFWPIALDKNEGDMIVEHMEHHGISVHLSTEMIEILGDNGHVKAVKTNKDQTIDTDIVAVTIGVKPQTNWLKESGIELDRFGGIVVDDNLRTNFNNIWAAGDCTSVVWFNDVRRPEQLWYTSRDQGKIAGKNIAGNQKIYKRGIFYNSAKFFDIEYTTAGYVNFHFEGEQDWFQREAGTNNTVRVTYLPDNTVIGFNMLGRRWDHRILVKWVDEKRELDWVVKNLHKANYDEEFMPKFKVLKSIGQGV